MSGYETGGAMMMKIDNEKKVIIYCRESRDDGAANYERIETQRDILVRYCKDKNLGRISQIIMDDNKSGTSFERLEPVKEKARRGEVNVLLCKDASRLGRNILESLAFTDFLDKHGVELVFESERYDEDIFPLIAWFNERRAKDDSVKIRRVMRHKMENGEMVIKAPYGYIKHGGELRIDTEAAAVVKEIFRLFLNGESIGHIIGHLNQEGYPTPSMLRSRSENVKVAVKWNRQHVGRILRHVAYTGDMPYGQREKLSYKSKKYIKKGMDEWIILRRHHEPVISREDFDRAQETLKKNIYRGNRGTEGGVFSGLLYCGRCGSRMRRKKRKDGKAFYVCGKNDREGTVKEDKGCVAHRISEEDLFGLAESYIARLITKYNIADKIAEIEAVESGEHKQKKEYEKKITKLKRKASFVYEDRLNGIIPEFLYVEKISTIEGELRICEENLLSYEKYECLSGEEITDEIIINDLKYLADNRVTSLLFNKILVFKSTDMLPQHKNEYCLADNEYELLRTEGGVLFSLNHRQL